MSSGGASLRPPQRVCFFGTYARGYTVTQLLRESCRAAGLDVVECHRPLWEHTRTKTAAYFGVRSALPLFARYARQARALARERRRVGTVDWYLVGFNGQLDVMVLRLLLRRSGVPIVFAPLITLTETLVDDRQVFARGSLAALLARALDRLSLSSATRVIIDTHAHRAYLSDTFRVPAARVSVWHLGADAHVFRPQPLRPTAGSVRVLHYGSCLPLHGVPTIMEAAVLLKAVPEITFDVIGMSRQQAATMSGVAPSDLAHVQFREWVEYAELGDHVAAADVCLGIFGTTGKARMVIPNKVYQAAAVGRPIITADTPAIREIFTHGETAWLCPSGDGAALADAVRILAADPPLRQRLASQAAALMAERFSAARQAAGLMRILTEAAYP